MHHYLSKYSFGETDLQLQADNCTGQNKNNFFLSICVGVYFHPLIKTLVITSSLLAIQNFLQTAVLDLLKNHTVHDFALQYLILQKLSKSHLLTVQIFRKYAVYQMAELIYLFTIGRNFFC